MQEHKKKKESIVCPNCGFSATRNYCAQCGQETHLHKETFLGLVTHFVGHYFHYDSKFWVTFKTLFTKPGMLTVAYWEKKRMRFIPPISLYIFVSIVFFLLFFSTVGSKENLREMTVANVEDSLVTERKLDSLKEIAVKLEKAGDATADSLNDNRIKQKIIQVFSGTDESAVFMGRFFHSAPKIFFFMVPIMAFILMLLYRRRKEIYYVDHAIFSLHTHAFFFLLFLPLLYYVPEVKGNWLDYIFDFLQTILPYIGVLYLIIAIHNAYRTRWVGSIFYGLIISVSYLFFLVLVAIGYFIFVFYVSYVVV